MLLDRRTLEGRPLGLVPGEEIPVPETVQAVIAARLDLLPPQQKSLLQDASVVGKVFWAGAVASVSGTESAEVLQAMHELARGELIRPARQSSMRDQEEYSFWHILVRDVAYGQIPRALRATKHRAAAAWIENMAEDRLEDHADVLAHHYRQALTLTLASGASDDEDTLRTLAARCLIMAGDRAWRLDLDKARSYYRMALETLPVGHADLPAVRVNVAEVAELTGEYQEAVSGYEEAIAEFSARGDVLGMGDAMVRLSRPLGDLEGWTRGRSVLADAIELLEQEPPGPELARAYLTMARSHEFTGVRNDLELATGWSEKALALAEELSLPDAVARALQFRGLSRIVLGQQAGVDDLRRALEMCLEHGLGSVETATSYGNLTYAINSTEGPAQAVDVVLDGLRFAEERGLTDHANWLRMMATYQLVEVGRWDEVLRLSDQMREWEREHPTESHVNEALVLLHRGEIGAAAAIVQQLLAFARGDHAGGGDELVTAALVESATGDIRTALGLMREWEQRTEDRPADRAWQSLAAVRVLIRAGELEWARRLVPEESKSNRLWDRVALMTRAVFREADGATEESAHLYLEAANEWGRRGSAFEQAQALLGRGRCLIALGRASDAIRPLEEAREIFESLRAKPALTETGALLERATAPSDS
jgi:tetratricopeptide (TPR) repeat protein